jgi:ligand-binding sensor domain-containing protein/two-component sensor histidine kinase
VPTTLRKLWLLVLLPAAIHTPAVAARLPLRRYTTQDGLPHNRVNRMMRDSHSFLWFCTANGLSQFDGTTFVNYGADRAFCRDIKEDPRGFYWVVSGGAGIYRLDPQTADPNGVLTLYTPPRDVNAAGVGTIVRDSSGTLWAGGSAGLFMLEERGGGGVLHAVDLPPAREQPLLGRVWSMLADRNGTLWIATEAGLLRRTPDGRVTVRPLRPGNPATRMRRMIQDPEGRIWAGHEAGVTVFVPDPEDALIDPHGVIQGVRFIRQAAPLDGPIKLPSAPGETRLLSSSEGMASGLVMSLLRASDGRTWITTLEGGVTVFDGTTFRAYTAAEGFGARPVTLAEDHEGNIWIGSQLEGAARLARNGFISYGPADGLLIQPRPAIVDSPAGEAVILSGRTLWVFDGHRFSPVRLRLPIREMPPVIRDRRGDWWIGTSAGLYRFAVSSVQDLASARPTAVYKSADGLSGDTIDSLCEDGSGDIWVSAGAGNTLAKWDRMTGTIRSLSDFDGHPVQGSVQACATDRAGGVWLDLSGGLVRFHAGAFTRFTENSGIPAAGVSGLIIDHQGRLWVTYSLLDGLVRCDDPTAASPLFARYTMQQGLTDTVIWAIGEDSHGRIYLGTPAGVNRLDPGTGRVRDYTSMDGLGDDETDDIFLDSEGVMWFASQQNVSSMRPRPDPAGLSRPRVRITALRAGGIDQPMPVLGRTSMGGVDLPEARSQIQIGFAAISFGLEGTLRFQYRMDGLDEDWSAPAGVRSVNYGSLPAGGYRFQVRAVNAEGAVSPEPATVSFTILPPLWRQWWFLSIAGLAAGGAALGIHRARIARLLAVERVRTRLAMDLHDDVGASLSQIAVMSEVARQEMGQAGAEVTGPLSRIADVSRGMVDAMSDIVWATNPGRDQMVDLVARMRRFATDLLTARGIDLLLTAPSPEQSLRLDPEVRRQVYLIFKEAVNNAARHSGCHRVDVALEVGRRVIALRVTDDGIGFEPDDKRAGHGLSSMSRRAVALDGSLQIVSKAGEGTTLTLVIPLRRPRSGPRNPPV